MKLAEFAALKKRQIYDRLAAGSAPEEGHWEPEILKEAFVKGGLQMGTTRYLPNQIHLEFLFSDGRSQATIFTVTLDAPQRIVFMPVPEWVTENIWQGDVDGSYHFEADAMQLLQAYGRQLQAPQDEMWFGRRPAKRRE